MKVNFYKMETKRKGTCIFSRELETPPRIGEAINQGEGFHYKVTNVIWEPTEVIIEMSVI